MGMGSLLRERSQRVLVETVRGLRKVVSGRVKESPVRCKWS